MRGKRFLARSLSLLLLSGFARGFLSDLLDRIADVEEEEPCETVRVMPRIVGGAPVRSEGSAPYIAAVGRRLENGSVTWFCGGSILSGSHVLTAAHCIAGRDIDVVRVGCLSLDKRFSDSDHDVLDAIVHPRYEAPKSYHDVAVIRLRKGIQFADNVKPVCLAKKKNKYEGRKAKVVGWGAEEVGGDGSQKLQQVEVEIVRNSYCDEAYQNSSVAKRSFPVGIHDGQLCAGSRRGGKDACQGDSGGPLVLADNEGVTRQVGVVSTGAGCGAKAYPGVYARVSTYHNWIRKQMEEDSGSRVVFRGR